MNQFNDLLLKVFRDVPDVIPYEALYRMVDGKLMVGWKYEHETPLFVFHVIIAHCQKWLIEHVGPFEIQPIIDGFCVMPSRNSAVRGWFGTYVSPDWAESMAGAMLTAVKNVKELQ